ncbi:MAG TPA: mechanosensitive ion channel domain-containing protein [Steroidobacteraceae bacterium]|nr:mechanosensitive ion channel domain-containing protein [Steroidobacteraceae bacterium]
MTCQRRGFGLACIVLCAAVLPVAQGAAAPSSGKSGASSSAAATAAPRITATTAPTPASAAQVRSPNPPASRAALPPLPLTGDAVLANIKQTLDWYRESQSLEQVPQLSTDVVERDRLRQTALTALRLAFAFGRAAAAQISSARTQAAQAGASGAGAAGGAGAGRGAAGTSATKGAGSAPSTSGAGGAGGSAGAAGAPAGAARSVSGASSSSAAPATGQSQRSLAGASERIASRIMQLQSQLSALDARLARAPARSRTAVRAERDQVAAALALEREVQTTINELQRFQSSMLTLQGSGAKDLLSQIADLERTVPEVRRGGSAERGSMGSMGGSEASGASSSGSSGMAGAGRPAGSPANGASVAGGSSATEGSGATATAAAFHPESAGIIALIGQWIVLQGANGQLNDMLKSTDALDKELATLRAPLVAQARALARSDTAGVDSTDTAELDASRRELEAAAARFRQLAAVVVPLGDLDFVLDNARATLIEWRTALHARIGEVARSLLTHVAILATLIVALLVVSEASRRAVFKYLHDGRLRSQFQTLRRVIVGALLAVMILFALVSQMGSLATYVGFLTAGLAVALQNVILSIVGYFFLIGRYGVRVGDRITLAGVTGRVVDIGLIRIYLMELSGADLHSTGRIVVLSNSVLFQPQALFKQIPGAEYLWHTISLTLAPNVDVQAAEQRLKDTANEVFEHYRSSIEAQHAAVRRLVEFDTSVPCPEVRVRFTEHGWQFDVRYPVHGEQAARIDQRMLKAVRTAVADAEHFPVVDSGAPVLQAQA